MAFNAQQIPTRLDVVAGSNPIDAPYSIQHGVAVSTRRFSCDDEDDLLGK
jgi:hypothetical protein